VKKLKIKYIGKRDILNFFELTEKQRELMQKDHDNAEELSFFINSRNEPEIFDFLRMENSEELKSFHGYTQESYFSGSLCILDKDCETFKLFEFYL
jgi:hypothetical protein